MKYPEIYRILARLCFAVSSVGLGLATGIFLGANEPYPSALLLEYVLVTMLFGIGYLTEKQNDSKT